MSSKILPKGRKKRRKAVKPGRGRKRLYSAAHRELLTFLWALLGFPSSRRLQAAIPDTLDNLELYGHHSLTPAFRAQMHSMNTSVSTQTRRLCPWKR